MWNLNFEGVHHRLLKNSEKATNPMEFNEHFDSSLPYDSLYHRNLQNVMDCVEKSKSWATTPEQEEKACGNEFSQLRVSAI